MIAQIEDIIIPIILVLKCLYHIYVEYDNYYSFLVNYPYIIISIKLTFQINTPFFKRMFQIIIIDLDFFLIFKALKFIIDESRQRLFFKYLVFIHILFFPCLQDFFNFITYFLHYLLSFVQVQRICSSGMIFYNLFFIKSVI